MFQRLLAFLSKENKSLIKLTAVEQLLLQIAFNVGACWWRTHFSSSLCPVFNWTVFILFGNVISWLGYETSSFFSQRLLLMFPSKYSLDYRFFGRWTSDCCCRQIGCTRLCQIGVLVRVRALLALVSLFAHSKLGVKNNLTRCAFGNNNVYMATIRSIAHLNVAGHRMIPPLLETSSRRSEF